MVADTTLADLELRATLGTGTFGRVRLVFDRKSKRVYALKIMNKEMLVKMKQVDHIRSERALLMEVEHPFVVNLLKTFQDDVNLYLLQEYVPGGEFFTHLRRRHRLSNEQAMVYGAEVALIFRHLHGLGIVYRDLKPENIILDRDGHLKLADFGFAKKIQFDRYMTGAESAFSVLERLVWWVCSLGLGPVLMPCAHVVLCSTYTLCGTPEYLAPEIIQQKGHGRAVDWWTLGILLYEMMTGHPPYYDESNNPLKVYEKIVAGKLEFSRSFTGDAHAKDLIRRLLHPDRTRRLGALAAGAADVLAHPWFAPIDWAALEQRRLRAPLQPRVASDDDTSNFEKYPEDSRPLAVPASTYRDEFKDF